MLPFGKGVKINSNSITTQVQLVFCPPEPVKIATIREIYLQTKEENLSRLVLILQSKILSRAREAIKEIFKFKVDIFQVCFCLVFMAFFPTESSGNNAIYI